MNCPPRTRVKHVRYLSGSSRASVCLRRSFCLPTTVLLMLFDVVSKANWARKARRGLRMTALKFVSPVPFTKNSQLMVSAGNPRVIDLPTCDLPPSIYPTPSLHPLKSSSSNTRSPHPSLPCSRWHSTSTHIPPRFSGSSHSSRPYLRISRDLPHHVPV